MREAWGIVNANSSIETGARSPNSSLSVTPPRQSKRRRYIRAVFGSKDQRFPKRDPEIEALLPGHLIPSSPQMLEELLRRSLELEQALIAALFSVREAARRSGHHLSPVHSSAASRMTKAPGMTEAKVNPKKGVTCIMRRSGPRSWNTVAQLRAKRRGTGAAAAYWSRRQDEQLGVVKQAETRTTVLSLWSHW
jgi:hypothetical protein